MALVSPVLGQPGIQSGTTVSYRQIFKQPEYARYHPGGGVIAAAAQDRGNTGSTLTLRPGLLMGRITSSKKWAPSVVAKVGTAVTSQGATSITLSVADALELVRRLGTSGTFKLTGPPTAGGVIRTLTVTYSAVNTSTGVVTVTAMSVNEVQTFNFTNSPSGTFRLAIVDSSGVTQYTQPITYSATIATLLSNLQTATDAVLASNAIVWSGTLVTAVAATFSGTGYAGLPQTLIGFDSVALTAGDVDITRTTAGVDGRFIAGSYLGAGDGSETPKTFIGDGSGISMVAANAADVDWPQLPVAGAVIAANLIDLPTDTSLLAWLKSNLSSFPFDTDFNGY